MVRNAPGCARTLRSSAVQLSAVSGCVLLVSRAEILSGQQLTKRCSEREAVALAFANECRGASVGCKFSARLRKRPRNTNPFLRIFVAEPDTGGGAGDDVCGQKLKQKQKQKQTETPAGV